MACRSVIMLAFLVITLVVCGLVPFVDAQRGGFRPLGSKFGSQNHLQNHAQHKPPIYGPIYGYKPKTYDTYSRYGAWSSGSASDHTAALFMVAVPLILIVALGTLD